MGFHAYSSPYDWSRIAGFKATAKTVPGGMIDLSVGSPVDPVPSSVQQALVAGADAPTPMDTRSPPAPPTLRPLSIHGSANCAGWI